MTNRNRQLSLCADLCATRGLRLAAGLVSNRQDAEDIAQEALMVAIRKSDQIPRKPWPWLATIITNLARNHWRKSARRGKTESLPESSLAAKDASPLEHALSEEMRANLRQALESLPDNQREILALIYMAGLSQRQAAKQRGQSLTTFRREHDASLKNLRTRVRHSEKSLLAAMPLLAIDAKASPALKEGIERALESALVGAPAISAITIGKFALASLVLLLSLAALSFTAGLFDTEEKSQDGNDAEVDTEPAIISSTIRKADLSSRFSASAGANGQASEASIEDTNTRKVTYQIDTRSVINATDQPWQSYSLQAGVRPPIAPKVTIKEEEVTLAFDCERALRYRFTGGIEAIYLEFPSGGMSISPKDSKTAHYQIKAYSGPGLRIQLEGVADMPTNAWVHLHEVSPEKRIEDYTAKIKELEELRDRLNQFRFIGRKVNFDPKEDPQAQAIKEEEAELRRREGELNEIVYPKAHSLFPKAQQRRTSERRSLSLNADTKGSVIEPICFHPRHAKGRFHVGVGISGYELVGVLEPIALPNNGEVLTITIRLQRRKESQPYRATLEVVDETGNPMAGVKVNPNFWRAPESNPPETTDARGHFPLLFKSRDYDDVFEHHVSVLPQGYAPQLVKVAMLAGGDNPIHRVELRVGEFEINGLISDIESGAPIEGVSITLTMETPPRLSSLVLPTIKSDQAGNYRFTGLEAGSYRLRFGAPEGVRMLVQNQEIKLSKNRQLKHQAFLLPTLSVHNDLDGEARVELTLLEADLDSLDEMLRLQKGLDRKAKRATRSNWWYEMNDTNYWFTQHRHTFKVGKGKTHRGWQHFGHYRISAFVGERCYTGKLCLSFHQRNRTINLSTLQEVVARDIEVSLKIDGQKLPAISAMIFPSHLDNYAINRDKQGVIVEADRSGWDPYDKRFLGVDPFIKMLSDPKERRTWARYYDQEVDPSSRAWAVGLEGKAKNAYCQSGPVTVIHPCFGVYYLHLDSKNKLLLDYDAEKISIDSTLDQKERQRPISFDVEGRGTYLHLIARQRSDSLWEIGPPPLGKSTFQYGAIGSIDTLALDPKNANLLKIKSLDQRPHKITLRKPPQKTR